MSDERILSPWRDTLPLATSPQTLRVCFIEINVEIGTTVPALPVSGIDALHNNVFGTRMRKDGAPRAHPPDRRPRACRSQRREPETSLFVLIARRMEPECSGSSSQRPLGLSSRVAFCYPGSLLVQGTAERARVPEIDLSRPDRKASATPLSTSLPPNRFPSPIAMEG